MRLVGLGVHDLPMLPVSPGGLPLHASELKPLLLGGLPRHICLGSSHACCRQVLDHSQRAQSEFWPSHSLMAHTAISGKGLCEVWCSGLPCSQSRSLGP